MTTTSSAAVRSTAISSTMATSSPSSLCCSSRMPCPQTNSSAASSSSSPSVASATICSSSEQSIAVAQTLSCGIDPEQVVAHLNGDIASSSSRTSMKMMDGAMFEVKVEQAKVASPGVALYGIRVHIADHPRTQPWMVVRRFSELQSVHDKLKSDLGVGCIMLPEFPPKKMFFSLDQSFLETRRLWLERYLQRLADCSIRNTSCKRALHRVLDTFNIHRYAASNDVEMVEHVLSNGVCEVNEMDRSGGVALHYACARGHREMVELLVQSGGNIASRDSFGLSPVDVAVANRHMAIAEFLRSCQFPNSSESPSITTSSSLSEMAAHLPLPLQYSKRPQECRFLVLFNPIGGRGLARSIIEDVVKPLFLLARIPKVIFQETTHSKHAEELGESLDLSSFDCLVVVSGDGVLFELINGMCARSTSLQALASMPVAIIPAGSGNSLACSLGFDTPLDAMRKLIEGIFRPVDLFESSIPSMHIRKVGFVMTAWGLITDADIDSEHLRWMGDIRFTIQAVKIILSKTPYRCRISYKPDDEDSSTSNNVQAFQSDDNEQACKAAPGGAFKAGPGWITVEGIYPVVIGCNIPRIASDILMAPKSKVDDGAIQLVLIGDASRTKMLKIMTQLEKGKHVEDPRVLSVKVSEFVIEPLFEGSKIDIDGEVFPNALTHVKAISPKLRVAC